MAINPMDHGSKDVVLDVVSTERGKFYDVIDNPDNWNVDTRCEGWEVRDMVGHMIDVTEGYLGLGRKLAKVRRPRRLAWWLWAKRLITMRWRFVAYHVMRLLPVLNRPLSKCWKPSII